MADIKIRLKNASGEVVYPETLASIVKTDETHLFVTSEEKTAWNGKFTVSKVDVLPEFAAADDHTLYVHNGMIYIKGEANLELIGGKEEEKSTITEKEIELGGDHQTALSEIVSPKHGDIAIIKELINGEKRQFTAYVYNNNAWVAMDGNYNAENVYFDKDLVTTVAVGNITLSGGQATIPAAGKNLKQVFDTIFVKESNPSITQPRASVSCPQAKAYEVGTKVTPSFTVSFNAGSYQYGPATGVTATSYSVTDTNSSPAVESSTGSFAELTVGDGTNYKINATVQHTEGAVPVTNVGNGYTAGKIAAGSKTASSGAITGYRAYFYGTNTTGDPIDDSAKIRATDNKGAIGKKTKENFAIPEGTKVVVIAVPASYKVTSVLDTGAFGTDIFASSFKQSTIAVEGVGGYEATNYNVYTYKPDAALGANTYQVTITNA